LLKEIADESSVMWCFLVMREKKKEGGYGWPVEGRTRAEAGVAGRAVFIRDPDLMHGLCCF
jgi:hypothetical protein